MLQENGNFFFREYITGVTREEYEDDQGSPMAT